MPWKLKTWLDEQPDQMELALGDVPTLPSPCPMWTTCRTCEGPHYNEGQRALCRQRAVSAKQ